MLRRPPRTARNKMMDLLARRDHSEKELRRKLKESEFPQEAIDKAIQFAHDRGWLGDPARLAEKMSEGLHKKKKGIQYINQWLYEKGLPRLKKDSEAELEKARAIIQNKFSGKLNTLAEKQKAGRHLQSRGFDLDIVRKVIYEKS